MFCDSMMILYDTTAHINERAAVERIIENVQFTSNIEIYEPLTTQRCATALCHARRSLKNTHNMVLYVFTHIRPHIDVEIVLT